VVITLFVGSLLKVLLTNQSITELDDDWSDRRSKILEMTLM